MNQAPGWRTVIVLLAALLVVSSPAFGQGIATPYGQPPIIIRAQPSYYVWVDQTGWHVRWSTPAPLTFSGTITTNGQFSGVCPAGGGLPSGLSFTGPQQAVFSIFARPGIGGFDFQTTGALVTFNLGVNTVQIPGRIPAWLIFIGQSLFPSLRPFTLSATPSFVQRACREPLISDVERPVTDR